MSDPYRFSDHLLGRIDLLRANAEGILKCISNHKKNIELAQTTSKAKIKENSLAFVKKRMEQAELSLSFLEKYTTSQFELPTNSLEEVKPAERNLHIELQWKREVHEKSSLAMKMFRNQLELKFPRMELLGKRRCPPSLPSYLTSKSTKKPRVGGGDMSEFRPHNLDAMLKNIVEKKPIFKFSKCVVTSKGGRKMIKYIRCDVNEEFSLFISFCPLVPQSGPSEDEVGVTASPVPPVTPPSSVTTRGSTRTTRSGSFSANSRKAGHRKKKDDMVTKVKQAQEEATKFEQDELMAMAASVREEVREKFLSIRAGEQLSMSIERVNIISYEEMMENESDGVWVESKFRVYQKLTQESRNVLRQFCLQYPATSFHHFFMWFSMFDKFYETKCRTCDKILAKDSDDALYLPPIIRDYSNGHAHHLSCYPL